MNIEDLTLVVISYEVNETSLWRVSKISYEMTTSIRFCFSYDPLKMGFYFLQIMLLYYFIRKCNVDTYIVNDVTYMGQSVITKLMGS